MSAEDQKLSEQSATTLVSGIIEDIQNLVKHQLQLTQREIEEEIRKATQAAWMFALGAGISVLGAIELCLALTHLLHWEMSPPGTDPASLPLWACHAVVGVVPLLLGGFLAALGRTKLRSINPMQNPATAALQENVAWATSSK